MNLKDIKVPKSLKDISWKKFYSFYKIEDKTFFKTAKVVAEMLDVDYEDVINEEASVVLAKFHQLSFLYEDMEALTKELSNEVTVDGVMYMIHDLTIFKEFATYATIEQRFKDTYDAIPYQLALLVRKPDESVDDINEILDERAEMFNSLPADEVIKLHNFFLFRSETLSNLIAAYSQHQMIIPQTHQQKEDLLNKLLLNILGSELPQNWLMKILRKWAKFLIAKRLMYYSY